MFLSDRDIRLELQAGELRIYPLADNAIQPASIDVRLGPGFKKIRPFFPFYAGGVMGEQYETIDQDSYWLEAGEFLLATTLEYVRVPPHLCIKIEGKSTRGRTGLQVENAGFADPGFHGQLTLELMNQAKGRIELKEGMLIAQLRIARLSSEAEYPYGSTHLGSHYQGQRGTTGAR